MLLSHVWGLLNVRMTHSDLGGKQRSRFPQPPGSPAEGLGGRPRAGLAGPPAGATAAQQRGSWRGRWDAQTSESGKVRSMEPHSGSCLLMCPESSSCDQLGGFLSTFHDFRLPDAPTLQAEPPALQRAAAWERPPFQGHRESVWLSSHCSLRGVHCPPGICPAHFLWPRRAWPGPHCRTAPRGWREKRHMPRPACSPKSSGQ